LLPNWVISCHRVVSRVSRVSDDWRAFGLSRDFAAEGKKALTGRDHIRLRKARVDMVLHACSRHIKKNQAESKLHCFPGEGRVCSLCESEQSSYAAMVAMARARAFHSAG
jgi:hypothetical protein